jgi:Ran GTPase-activating protein (RanGAP) involved in mRNA processing and transport
MCVAYEILQKNTHLTCLDLRGNKLGDSDVAILCKGLLENKTITKLDLSKNGIGVDGAKALAVILRKLPVTALCLNHNNITNEGMVDLLNALKTSETLIYLSLDGDKMGLSDAKALGEFLGTNTSLPHLSLNCTDINDECIPALIKGLEKNTTLTRLNLWMKKIEQEKNNALINVCHNKRIELFIAKF